MLLFLLRWMTRRLLFFSTMCQQRFFCQSVRALQRGIVANAAQTECVAWIKFIHTMPLRCPTDGFERPLEFLSPYSHSHAHIHNFLFYAILSPFQEKHKNTNTFQKQSWLLPFDHCSYILMFCESRKMFPNKGQASL